MGWQLMESHQKGKQMEHWCPKCGRRVEVYLSPGSKNEKPKWRFAAHSSGGPSMYTLCDQEEIDEEGQLLLNNSCSTSS